MDKQVLSRMQTLCSRREYCTREIAEKIRKAIPGAGSDEVEEMLQSLTEDKYVDDLRYSSAFARDKSSLQGWGPIKIRHMLSAKGIAPSVITEALAEIDTAKADDRLRRLVQAKARTLEGDPMIKYKLIRFALSRGYDPSDIDLKDIIRGEDL